jgi:hypothetical protein
VSRIELEIIERRLDGSIKGLTIDFGLHYVVDVFEKDGRVICQIGTTHHGIKADASEVGGELEHFIDELKARHRDNTF